MNEKIPAWVNGKLKPVDKLEVHRKGLKHKAISIFIFYKNEILLQKRAMSKYHTPGLWTNTCCTHPKWNEDSKVCANRRLYEELGIVECKLEYKNKITYKANVGNDLIENEVVDIFITTIQKKDNFNIGINPKEVMDTKWVKIEDVQSKIVLFPEVYTPWFRIYLTKFANVILSN